VYLLCKELDEELVDALRLVVMDPVRSVRQALDPVELRDVVVVGLGRSCACACFDPRTAAR
jgi:hypothetical protein